MTFIEDLETAVNSSIANNYDDNFDHYRFGKELGEGGGPPFLRHCRDAFRKLLTRRNESEVGRLIAASPLAPYLSRLAWLYGRLADDWSRELLIRVLAYRILGYRKVKLPLSNPAYWEGIREMERHADPKDFVPTDFLGWKLYRQRLSSYGYPIELYLTAKGAYTEFVLRQYEYRQGGRTIGVAPGDVVVDAGACWGDTALLFAHETGPGGRVLSFEFLPSNLAILRKNLSFNPALAERVKVVEHPLWSESGKSVWYTDNGPGSSVGFEQRPDADGRSETVAIDGLVREEGLDRVDFIKMDIEGAETHALRGAKETIRKHRPKLAIALYHSLDDFVDIPEFIDSLDLGYTFYLGHFSIHSEETILYAVAHKEGTQG